MPDTASPKMPPTRGRATRSPSGRSVVLDKGLGANRLVSFVDALNEMGKIFESPIKLDGKSFIFEPLAMAA